MCVAHEVLDFFGGCSSEPQQFQRSKNWTVHINSNGCNEQGRASKEALLRTLWNFCVFFLFCFRFSCLFLRGRRCQNIWACVVLCVTVCGRCGKNICDVCVAGLAIRHGVSVSVLVAGAVITIWVYVSMQPASLCSRNTVQKMRLCCVFCVIRYPNYPVKRYAYELLECRVFRLLYCTVGYKLTKRSMAVFWGLGCFWHWIKNPTKICMSSWSFWLRNGSCSQTQTWRLSAGHTEYGWIGENMRDGRHAENKRWLWFELKKYLDALQKKKPKKFQVCDQTRKDWSGVDRVGHNKENLALNHKIKHGTPANLQSENQISVPKISIDPGGSCEI